MSTNSDMRTRKEMESLFKDPKAIRTVWKNVGAAILRNPAVKPVPVYDKDGSRTLQSLLEDYSYQQLSQDLKTLGQEAREPTELEMILMCQIVKARSDTSAAIFVRDTLGAKPVDESKIDHNVNQFESLSDDELEMLAKYREEHKNDA